MSCLRYINSDSHFSDSELAMLLRSLQVRD